MLDVVCAVVKVVDAAAAIAVVVADVDVDVADVDVDVDEVVFMLVANDCTCCFVTANFSCST